jgi:signal transduction histidine kinase
MVSKAIERAQNTVEQRNAEIRKDVLKYDEVMNEQRKVIYKRRDQILDNADLREESIGYLADAIDLTITTFCDSDERDEWDLHGLHSEVAAMWPTELAEATLHTALTTDDLYETIMSEATRRLLSLFETWMKGDRLQQAMQELRPQPIALEAWLRELIDSQTLMHDKHPMELQLGHPAGEIWADENLLEVAMLNLIDNACKYSEPGRPVLIEIRSKSGWVGIAVSDQGCGIEAKDHGAIFDDYYRVRPEGAVPGIGLGLAFVRRIVQLHQGDLELSSVPGQGSCFCLWLPHNLTQAQDLP